MSSAVDDAFAPASTPVGRAFVLARTFTQINWPVVAPLPLYFATYPPMPVPATRSRLSAWVRCSSKSVTPAAALKKPVV